MSSLFLRGAKMGTAGVDVRTMARDLVALIREHREAVTLEQLVPVPGMGLAEKWTDIFFV